MKKKIFGYWHLWLTNHFEEVIREQLKCLLDSGLYDASENIYIGCLGDNKDFYVLSDIVRQYPKFIISEYSQNKELYEFHTLNILKEQADSSREDYYLYYFHGKGLSFSKDAHKVAYHGGGHWRQHMNEYTLIRWKENVAMLDLGYETCGTQLRPNREWPMHYSGSYYWCRSEYVKLLKPIDTLNLRDRFQAEYFIGRAHPIAATLSQEFVDYFNPKNADDLIKSGMRLWEDGGGMENENTGLHKFFMEEKKGRTIVHTLCWALYSDIERAVESLYALNDKGTFEHILADLDFPLQKGDQIPDDLKKAKKSNSKKLKALADKHGSKYVKMKNEGVSQNWSTIFKEEELGDGDVLICCDPDEMVNPKCYGWVKAVADVIREDDKYGVVSLIMEEQFASLNDTNSQQKKVSDIRVIDVQGGAMWAQIGVSCKLLKQIGGVPFPKEYPIYGHLEGALQDYMNRLGYKWCFLPDYIVKHPEWDFDDYLRQWKHYILENKKDGQITFENFLVMKKEGRA